MLKINILTTLIGCTLISCQPNSGNNTQSTGLPPTNLWIGTGGHGHTYPGAQMPYGMVQLSPDNGKSGWDWVSGYHYSDSVVVGFSHTHLSGTGIGDLQDISVMPTIHSLDLKQPFSDRMEKPYAGIYSHQNETAHPGYYKVQLTKPEIQAELTTTLRTGFHRYTFKEKGERNILIDLGYAQNWDAPIETAFEWIDSCTVRGKRLSSGWAANQHVYFYLQFSEPVIKFNSSELDNVAQRQEISGKNLRALFTFDPTIDQIMVKVAISSVSTEGAQKNMETENQTWNFDQVKQQAELAWANTLNKIEIKGGTPDEKTIFYTALYHTAIAPTLHSDVDMHYRGGDQQIHQSQGFQYYSGLSLWDTFRAHNPLTTILNPDIAGDIAQTLLAHYNETGTLPVWVLSGNETNCMTGYHSAPMLAEAVLKNIGNLDAQKALDALKNTMLQDQRGLKEMREFGFVPMDKMDESVTISLELAYNDYATAMVAQKLGAQDDYNYFLNRSMAYQKLFDENVQFMRGKDSKGVWRKDFDPKHSAHRVGTDYTEGNAWQHSWFVLHDVQGLINLFGGDQPFATKLDQLFTESSEITGTDASPDISGLIGQYAHGNEPSHHIAYLYNYIGQPWKTQEMVHRIRLEQYTNTPDGISGNEDMGQMSAWYVLSSLGFYPVNPVDGNLILGTPLFEQSTIELPGKKQFKIVAHNHSSQNYYVEQVKLNNQPLPRTYITYQELMQGGVLEFYMTNQPNKTWGTDITSRPPSVSKTNQ